MLDSNVIFIIWWPSEPFRGNNKPLFCLVILIFLDFFKNQTDIWPNLTSLLCFLFGNLKRKHKATLIWKYQSELHIHFCFWSAVDKMWHISPCCLPASVLPVSMMWRLPCQHRGPSPFLALCSPLWVFPGVGRKRVPPCLNGCNLAISLCLCIGLFFFTSLQLQKTWTVMTQAAQSTPWGEFSANENNKWTFCLQRDVKMMPLG